MTLGLLDRFFPPPSFMTMPAMGFDLSDHSLHILNLERGSNGLVVGAFGTEMIPQGLIDQGVIKDPGGLVEVLSGIRSKYKIKSVNMSLAEQPGYIVMVRVPKVDIKDLYTSIELQLEEHVPLTAEEAVFAYDIVSGLESDAREYELNLSVYPRQIVESYIEVLQQAGMEPLRFEIEAHAIARCVIPKGNGQCHFIVDMGRTRTSIFIVSDEVVRFSSTVNIGVNSIIAAVARDLSIETKEVEQLLRTIGLQGDQTDETSQKVALASLPTLSALQDELLRHFNYWNTHRDIFGKKRKNIEKVIMVGGLANLPGIIEYLESNLGLSVEMSNVFVNVNSFDNYIPSIPQNESLSYATAVGLALLQS